MEWSGRAPAQTGAYPTGPKDSIFAMGVASIKWAELESVLHFMFGTIFDLDLARADSGGFHA